MHTEKPTRTEPTQQNAPVTVTNRIGRLLDPPATPQHWGVWESCALLVWLAVASCAAAQHVPWADEAQAWMLAHDSTWSSLFLHGLHYEGEGGLWHAFLKCAQLLHVPFAGMRWLAIAVQGTAIALLLRFAPFPRVVRVALPFLFFLLYQDAVVARSYTLYALLAFAAAALLRSAKPRPIALAVLAGLLSLLSIHGVVLSAGLALVALARWRKRARLLPAVGVLACFWLVAASVMAPARDIDFPAGNNLHRSLTQVERSLGMHPPPAPERVTALPMAGLQPPVEATHVRHGVHSAMYRAARWLGVITFPLSSWRWFALLVAGWVLAQGAITIATVGGASGAVGLVPYGLMVAVFSSLYMEPRHAGTLLTAFLVTAWLTWPGGSTAARTLRSRVVARGAAILLLLAVCGQLGWTARILVRERTEPYSPDRMTAEFLKSQGVGRGTEAAGAASPHPTVAGFYYFSVGPLAYFSHNIYLNQPAHRYWLWSTSMRSMATVQAVLAQHPDFVVVGGTIGGPDVEVSSDWRPNPAPLPGIQYGDGFHIADYFRAHGYRTTHVFCGYRWMRASYDEQVCDVILQPVQQH